MGTTESDMLALRELPGVGERTLNRLVETTRARGESLRRVLRSSPLELESTYGLPAQAIDRLCRQRARHFDRCRQIETALENAGGRLLTRDRTRYPQRLQASLSHPPPLLFALGNAAILDRTCIAILNSREIGEQTLPALVAVVRAAHDQQLCVAIGGMKSTHRLAAIAARASGVDRIVVLDRGLLSAFGGDFRTDPFGCGPRRQALDRTRTLVLSCFRPEDHAAPVNGRRRDEIIAAVADIVFAGAARPGGEVERLCRAALARGAPVVLWRVSANRALIRAGAHAVDGTSLSGTIRRLRASLATTARP